MQNDDLTQRDFSNRDIAQMSSAERAEMRRRYEAFIEALRRTSPPSETPPERKAPRPWRPPGAR